MGLGEMHLTDCKISKTIILKILMSNIYCADEGKELFQQDQLKFDARNRKKRGLDI